MSKPTLAIIGTGIAGMGAGYFLREGFDITFYERNNYAGGHTNTLTIDEDGQPVYIDSAFMVYNEPTYPLLTRLFKELEVETKPTDMSFSVQHVESGLEYCGTGLSGLFAQRQNIFKHQHIKMLLDISRFRKEAEEVLTDPRYQDYSLSRYIQEKKYSEDFLNKFLIPMSSAVWSTPFDLMLEFPAATLVRFFKNHCFLDIKGHLSWRTCVGGSLQYRDKIMQRINAQVLTNNSATAVYLSEHHVLVCDSNTQRRKFDYVLLACHANEALDILSDASPAQKDLLSQFPYHINRATLHTDEKVMPRLKRVWSSWNYRQELDGQTSTIYWMNNLQGVSRRKNYFISINDPGRIDSQKVLWKSMYAHPLYSVASQKAQEHLQQLNAGGRVFFAGAYFRYGFHEDGLWSGLQAARAISGEKIWN